MLPPITRRPITIYSSAQDVNRADNGKVLAGTRTQDVLKGQLNERRERNDRRKRQLFIRYDRRHHDRRNLGLNDSSSFKRGRNGQSRRGQLIDERV